MPSSDGSEIENRGLNASRQSQRFPCSKPIAEARSLSLTSAPRLAPSSDGPRLRLGSSCWFFLAFHLRQALLESRHKVYDRGEFRGLLARRHFSAFEFCLDQLLQVLLKTVSIFLRVPLISERFDQLVRNFQFGFLQLNIGTAEAFHLPHFIC